MALSWLGHNEVGGVIIGFCPPPEGGEKLARDVTSLGRGGMLTMTGAWGGGGVNTMPPSGIGAEEAEDRSIVLPRVLVLNRITP